MHDFCKQVFSLFRTFASSRQRFSISLAWGRPIFDGSFFLFSIGLTWSATPISSNSPCSSSQRFSNWMKWLAGNLDRLNYWIVSTFLNFVFVYIVIMIVTLQNIMVKNLKNIIVRKAADCAVEGERSPMLVQPDHNFLNKVWSGLVWYRVWSQLFELGLVWSQLGGWQQEHLTKNPNLMYYKSYPSNNNNNNNMEAL